MFEIDSNKKCVETWNIALKASLIFSILIGFAILFNLEKEEILKQVEANEVELIKPVE